MKRETNTVNGTNTTYQLKIDKDVNVKVIFEHGSVPAPTYTKVPYGELATYLANTASSTEINYIEITGDIPIEDFKEAHNWTTSALGKKLRNASTKKVALKIETYPAGLTDMSNCFFWCKNLVSLNDAPPSRTKSRFWGRFFCIYLTKLR